MRTVRGTGTGKAVGGGAELFGAQVFSEEGGDAPAVPGGDVLVRIAAAGICGSDLGYLAMGSTLPLGHELAGTTADGTRVAVEAIFGCGACDQCAAGSRNRCRTVHERVPGLSIAGGMADAYTVPASTLVELPAGLPERDACLVEPAAVAWHAARIAGTGPGTRVAVVGGGAIGLLAVAAARELGAPEVALVARRAERMEAGERLGAVSGATGEFDVVIDAAGTADAVASAVGLAGPGGTLSVAALHEAHLPLPFLPAFVKELRIVNSMAYGNDADGVRDVDRAAAMLAAHPEIADAVVTHRFPLQDAAEAFRTAADRSSGAIKVVVEP